MRPKKTVFISGGGTGGHLYPALAVGQKLREKERDLEIIFIGSRREVEREIMEKQGEKFIQLRIQGLRGRGIKAILSLPLVAAAFLTSIFLVMKKNPSLVIGAGGYSSGPVVLAASLLGKPTLIMEQNARPGFTNRLLRPFVRRAVVSFPGTASYFGQKGVYLGNPVREGFARIKPRTSRQPFTLLIFGGSQGSHFLNRMVVEALPWLKARKDQLKIFHQTGPTDFPWIKKAYALHGFSQVIVAPYFLDMPDRFAQADLILCRAGATSIAEIIAARKPALLIPFARATENHQYWNAYELVSRGAADMLLEGEATAEVLAKKILAYFDHPEELTRLEERLSWLQVDQPEEKIASLCLELMSTPAGRN